MKKLWMFLVGIAAICAAVAAPVVVTPGSVSGYIYLPQSASSGGGNEATLSAATCNDLKVFANVQTFSTVGGPYNWSVPSTSGCIAIEVEGGTGGAGGGGGMATVPSYSGNGGNGGDGGDSYVLSANGEVANIGCGGGGGTGGKGFSTNAGMASWNGYDYVYAAWPVTTYDGPNSYSPGGTSGHQPNRTCTITYNGSAWDRTTCDAAGYPAAYAAATFPIWCYVGNYGATWAMNAPGGGVQLWWGGGLYPGTSVGAPPGCSAPNFHGAKGANGGRGYRNKKAIAIAPNTALTIYVGAGGGGGQGGLASAGANGSPSATWLSGPTYTCSSNLTPVAVETVGGNGSTNVATPGAAGAAGAAGYVKIYY